MKLTYRGVSYERTPPSFELAEGEISGKYRGTAWQHKYPRHITVPEPKLDLKYRGTTYCVGDPIDVEATRLRRTYAPAATSVVPKTEEMTVPKTKRYQASEELRHIHRNNICCSLERRLQAARAKGDEKLIRLLEAESKQIGDCSLVV